MAANQSDVLDMIFARNSSLGKSLISITGRASMLKMLEGGQARNATDSRMVTL